MRKIIQIATGNDDSFHHIYALCNDGTFWFKKYDIETFKYKWVLDMQIPQPENAEAQDE